MLLMKMIMKLSQYLFGYYFGTCTYLEENKDEKSRKHFSDKGVKNEKNLRKQ